MHGEPDTFTGLSIHVILTLSWDRDAIFDKNLLVEVEKGDFPFGRGSGLEVHQELGFWGPQLASSPRVCFGFGFWHCNLRNLK